MFGFSYYLLLPLARGTNGNGYSSSAPLLPTPLASDTGDVGKGLDIQISANGSYRKMNKDGKAWTARLLLQKIIKGMTSYGGIIRIR